jgi:hypothetical protein
VKRRPQPARAEGAAETTEQLDPTPRPSTDPPLAPVVVHRQLRLADIVHKLLWTIDDVCAMTGISRRVWERGMSSGAMPAPSLRIGRRVYYFPEVVRTWVESGGQTRGAG